MKIVLIHGDNKFEVQKRVKSIVEGVKKKGWKIKRVDKNVLFSDIFTSNTLLPESILCIFEGVNNLSTINTDWLKNNAKNIDGSLLLVHNGQAPKRPLTSLKKLISEEQFSIPKRLFVYLESIFPGNGKQSIKLLHDVLILENIELVVAMMGRHLRDLFWVKMDSNSLDIPEWRKSKLSSQASKFSDQKLKKVISDIAKADYEAKSGGTDLLTSIDLMIVRELT